MTLTSSIKPLSTNSSTAQPLSLAKSLLSTKAWLLRLRWHTHAYLTIGVMFILTLLSLSFLHLHSFGYKIVLALIVPNLVKAKSKNLKI